MKRPFVYIAALRRTGSTLLCEALSQPPYCFILNEPNLARRRFTLREQEARTFRALGVDLEPFVRRHRGWRRFRILRDWIAEILPRLDGILEQVGVKEIFHEGWRRYLDAFPDARVVLTARDPRDVFLSLEERWRKGRAIWSGPFTPERVAASLEREFRHQQEMARCVETFRVRYEDLCGDPGAIEAVKRFAGCAPELRGEIGAFLRTDPRRVEEGGRHGGRITSLQVDRWRSEANPERRRQAQQVFEALGAYREFWGYR